MTPQGTDPFPCLALVFAAAGLGRDLDDKVIVGVSCETVTRRGEFPAREVWERIAYPGNP